MNDVVTLISNCGFPIAMCLMLAWYVKSLNETINNTIGGLCSKIDSLIQAINSKKEE